MGIFRLAFLYTTIILTGMNILNHIAELSRSNWSPVLADQYSSWHHEVLLETWRDFADIQDHYAEAECKTPGRVMFHILKKKAVIYVHVEYAIGWVYVRFVGSNEEFVEFLKQEKEVA